MSDLRGVRPASVGDEGLGDYSDCGGTRARRRPYNHHGQQRVRVRRTKHTRLRLSDWFGYTERKTKSGLTVHDIVGRRMKRLDWEHLKTEWHRRYWVLTHRAVLPRESRVGPVAALPDTANVRQAALVAFADRCLGMTRLGGKQHGGNARLIDIVSWGDLRRFARRIGVEFGGNGDV